MTIGPLVFCFDHDSVLGTFTIIKHLERFSHEIGLTD